MPQWPVDSTAGHEARVQEDLARSTAYFPAVGLIVGAWAALIFWLASRAWHPPVAVTLAIAATVWITGAFHEDALADAFDGLGGGWSKEQILSIMKDSRIGSYGAVALALMLVAKIAVLSSMNSSAIGPALISGSVLGRWSSMPLMRRYDYVREGGGRNLAFARSVTPGRLLFGTLTAVIVVMVALAPRPVAGVASLAIAAIVTVAAGRYFFSRIGGITGDCLGAANQFVELATYLVLAAHWRPV